MIFFFLYKVNPGECSWLVANICLWARSWAPPKFFLEPSSALQFPLYTVILLFRRKMKYINCLQFAAIFVGWGLFIKKLTMSLVIYERRLVVQNNILWGNTNNIAQKQHMHFCTLHVFYALCAVKPPCATISHKQLPVQNIKIPPIRSESYG